MTRPRAQSEEFVARFGARFPKWLDIIFSPLMRVVPLERSTDKISSKGVVFTSVNGVTCFGASDDRPVFCVGQRTRDVAASVGWNVHASFDTAEDLVEGIAKHDPTAPLVHVCGVHRRGDIADRLTARGIFTQVQEVYDQRLEELTKGACLAGQTSIPLLVPLFSPRTARRFAECYSGTAPLHVIALSQAVLSEIVEIPMMSRHVALKPNAYALSLEIDKVLGWVERDVTRR